MVRNSPMQVWQNADGSSIKTKRGHCPQLHYIAGYHSTSQHNKAGPLFMQDGRRCSQTFSNVPIFLQNMVVINPIWMQASALDKTQPGGSSHSLYCNCSPSPAKICTKHPVLFHLKDKFIFTETWIETVDVSAMCHHNVHCWYCDTSLRRMGGIPWPLSLLRAGCCLCLLQLMSCGHPGHVNRAGSEQGDGLIIEMSAVSIANTVNVKLS